MPLSDTIIILISSFAIGTSIFTIYLVQKFKKELKEEEKVYEDEKAREVRKSVDFFSEKQKAKEKPKKTLGEVELEV